MPRRSKKTGGRCNCTETKGGAVQLHHCIQANPPHTAGSTPYLVEYHVQTSHVSAGLGEFHDIQGLHVMVSFLHQGRPCDGCQGLWVTRPQVYL
eukprot:1160077-Pelagomonas_calceolata.AAC.4